MSASTATAPQKAQAQPRGRVSKSPTRLAFERFMYNKAAVVSVFVLLVIIFISIAAPLFTHLDPTHQYLMETDAPPGGLHVLGTDKNGFDLFSRDLYGGRNDLLIGFVDTLFVMAIGILLGGLAGYYGGWVDSLIMRFCDFMLNFPFFLLIIVLTSIFNSSGVWLLIVVIAVVFWPPTTRMVRGLFLNLRESEFVLAAKMAGASPWRIMFRHMLPNIMGTLVVNATFTMANLIAVEAALAVIGFGVQPPNPSWGNVLNDALDYFTLKTEPWVWLPPAALLTITILCINFIGDGLRDAFDPSFEK
ncbi:oligopeptide ABC transporter permease [Alicyclobacillus macrosporangiidus]|uniref:oligopeptide ABC transporter permease n=1 Tax=Alicyclobacillus macrosporangiidus TaxID=392015 RepID=UPI0005502D71|nr:oligopeptide ABC transporter permease [Alicyclobacillus macrosporangiidus]